MGVWEGGVVLISMLLMPILDSRWLWLELWFVAPLMLTASPLSL